MKKWCKLIIKPLTRLQAVSLVSMLKRLQIPFKIKARRHHG